MIPESFLHKRIEKNAFLNADKTAVIFNNCKISYGELNRCANQLANCLISEGVEKDTPVALFLEHNQGLAISILAVLKTGAYYVPLSVDYPAEKIRSILYDCDCKHVISNATFPKISDEKVIDANHPTYANYPDTNPEVEVCASDKVYVLYTSGSTGKPKGVIINHGNLSYYVDWYLENLFPKIGNQLAFTSSICFAAAVKQFYVPLVTGSVLQIVPPEITRNSGLLFNWYAEHPDHGLYVVPTLWEEHLLYARSNKVMFPKFLILSGEAVKESLVAETFELNKNIDVWNLYGPTETVANISYAKIREKQAITIGHILEGSEGILVDDELNEIDKTDIGELLVTGPGVTFGYLNRDELNKQQFVQINGKRYYRTGDYVSFFENGEIVFKGRKDRQVKINGVRIELSEIEGALNSIDSIRDSALLVGSSDSYNKKLYAFVLSSNGFDPLHYINQLKNTLPGHSIPANIFSLDEFPKLKNGKTDYKQLQQYLIELLRNGATKQRAENKIIAIVQELLDDNEVNENDNLFSLGASSMMVIKLINRINLHFNTDIGISDIYSRPILKDLIAFVEQKQEVSPSEKTEIKGENNTTNPLAVNQKTLWMVNQTKEVKHAHNIIFSIKFNGPHFSAEKLKNSLDKLVRKNDLLRSVFHYENGEPVYKIRDGFTPELIRKKVSSDEELQEFIYSHNVNLLNERDIPPVRYLLSEKENNNYELTVLINHIIFDGYSINVFAEKLLAEYFGNADLNGNPEAGYSSFVKKQAAKKYDEEITYWTDQIKSDSYTLNLPTDYLRPEQQSFSGNAYKLKINGELKSRLNTFCQQHDVSFFNLFLSAFSILLHKYSNQNDLLISFPYANRDDYHFENILGYFVNVVLFRSQIEKNNRLVDVLKSGKETLVEGSKYWECPIEEIYPHLHVETDPALNPLYQVMFAWHEQLISGNNGDTNYSVEELSNKASRLDLFLEAQGADGHVELRFNYNTSIFKEERIARFAADYLRILNQFLHAPETQLGDFSLVTTGEISLMQEWNNTGVDYDEKLVFYDLFEKAIEKNPENIALYYEDETFTYRELNAKVCSFANHLANQGVEKGELVGISISSCPEMLISILSVLKLGAAYVPLDPDYPKARIDYMIANSGLKYILTKGSKAEHAANMVVIDTKTITEEKAENRVVERNPEDTMYVIYTSGSTGKSKGVVLPNKGVANYLLWMKDFFGIQPEDVFLYRTSINFDISVWELMLPLISGAAVVINPKEKVNSPDLVLEIIGKYKITIAQFVPSALWTFTSVCKTGYQSSLKKVFVGGERLSNELKDSFLNKVNAELINLYGPTEASIFCTSFACDKNDKSRVSIGKPIYNAQIFILDENLKQLPIGSKGEIYIGGDVLAKGYMNNESETNARFIKYQQTTLFKTGDIGSFREDGNIDFWGRTDKQVKVRGFRIELSEIENVLSAMPEIKEVCVLLKKISSSDKRIIAFYTLNENIQEGAVDKKVLVAHLKEHLPDYMLPSELVCLEKIPVLPNGKVDGNMLIKKLDLKEVVRSQKTISNNFLNEVEKKIAGIWELVLRSKEFGPDDNFFEVGGHSLLLLEIKKHIELVLKKEIPLVDFYKYTTVKTMAQNFMKNPDNVEKVNAIRERVTNISKRRNAYQNFHKRKTK